MTKVSRNDIFVRDERGPEWLNDFLRSYSGSQPNKVQEILEALHSNKPCTVASMVQSYRKQVGLDALSQEDYGEELSKTASVKDRPLSIRHAQEQDKSVIEILENDPKLSASVDSLCEHSGGNRNTISIIRFLREMLGKDKVSYTDDALKEYIEKRKSDYKNEGGAEENPSDVGRVGITPEDHYDDDVADYATYDGAK